MSAESRKAAIVNAALPLFARKGFAETTTRELARAANISEPLLYKHFRSKIALYREIQNYSCAGINGVVARLASLKPCTSTLVHLVYQVMRALILGLPASSVPWETRHRLMLKSLLEDGAYARVIYRERFAPFCSQIEESIKAAIKNGDIAHPPASAHNAALFAHHVAAWIAIVGLPEKPVMEYVGSREELFEQAVLFALRGLGLSERALKVHYNPKALALFFEAKS